MQVLKQSKTFSARIENLAPSLDFVMSCATASSLLESLRNPVELSVEEILLNIYNYAYPEQQGEVSIVCSYLQNNLGDYFFVEISDMGIPFDILSAPPPDISAEIKDRPIGRLGIYLVKNLMDDVRYRRENGQNIVTLMMKNTEH